MYWYKSKQTSRGWFGYTEMSSVFSSAGMSSALQADIYSKYTKIVHLEKNWTKTVHLTACILVEFLDITDTSINQQQWYKRDWFSFKIYITIYICIWHCSDQGKIFDKKYGVYFCFCYKFPTWHPRLLHRKSLYSYIIIL